MTATLIRDDNCCANCGASVDNQYCECCGQKGQTTRLDLGTLLVTGFRALLEFDNKIWRTLRGLTLNPGQVSLDYIGGARVAYVNPIKYLLAAVAISYALILITGEFDKAMEATKADFSSQELNEDQRELYETYMGAVRDVVSQYADLMSLLSVPLLAFCIRLQNWRQGKNFAEILTFVSFVWAHVSILSIPITLFYAATGFYWHWTKLFIVLALLYWGNKVFFNRGWLRNILSTFGYTIYFMLIYSVLTQLFVAARLKGWM